MPLARARRRPRSRSRPSTARRRSTTRARRASPRRSTPTPRRPTTTARRSPATPASCSPTRPATPAPSAITFADLLGGLAMLLGRFVPLLAALAVAGSLAGKRVAPAGAGHVPHRHARRSSSCWSASIVLVARADLLPRPAARPGRPGPDRPSSSDDATRPASPPSLAVVVFTVAARPRLPAGHRPASPRSLFPGKADGSQVERDGKVVGSRLIGQDFTAGRATATRADPRYFQPRPSADRLQRRRHLLHQPRPEQQGARATRSRTNLAAYLALERPYDPGLTARRRARRRGDDLGLRRRPAHLRGQRAHPGPPRRRGARPAARPRAASWSTSNTDGRVARRPRRARRERARAQPRPRPGGRRR